MKILITSDNHLGFNETDRIRGNDSFNTFEEILHYIKSENVDLVLQAGDLFHYNKPSQNTYYKTFQLLKKYITSNNKNIRFQNISTSSIIPILAIHGNHDDPSGFNAISPMDILHASGFIHYFGKFKTLDHIEIEPIILQSNGINIAIYGFGYIKDRKLFKLVSSNKIIYKKLEGEYYNILMVHQNRTFHENEYFPEECIPSWFDLVIFGHEHSSEKFTTNHFNIIQVGSSVRTSLCEYEKGDKFVYFLEIANNQAHITRKKLETVRPLYIDTLKVDDEDYNKKIYEIIQKMLVTIKQENTDLLPLLRIRIECSKKYLINKYDLDIYVDGKIANIKDYLKIIKKYKIKENNVTVPQVNQTTFIDIFHQMLTFFPMKIIDNYALADGITQFLQKEDKNIFSEVIEKNKQAILKYIDIKNIGLENIDDIIYKAKAEKDSVELQELTIKKLK